MPEIEHNAPKFKYHLFWKRDFPGEQWQDDFIADWRIREYRIDNQETYQRYRIKVVSENKKGQANVAAEEVIGYSGEAEPTQAPSKFELRQVVGPRSAIMSWEAIDPTTINGEFKGYKIQTWTEKSGEEKFREIIMKSDSTLAHVQAFKPFAKNYARVLAFNGAYDGPPSNVVVIETPEGKPGPVDLLECFSMGSSALLLAWKRPEEINGMLNGYRIYYQEVEGTKLGPLLERKPRIMNVRADKAKLAGLKPHSKYRVTIRATTKVGEGMPYYTECDTNPQAPEAPDLPKFKYRVMNPEQGQSRIKVTWQPNINGNPGSHFYVQYKKQHEPQFISTKEELNEDSIVIRGLDPDYVYDFRVVAVDGSYEKPSEVLQVYAYSKIPPTQRTKLEHSGWFIGMLLAVIFLILVCVVVCLVKRNRGGKYAVQEREERQGRRDPYDEGGFPEYTQP